MLVSNQLDVFLAQPYKVVLPFWVSLQGRLYIAQRVCVHVLIRFKVHDVDSVVHFRDVDVSACEYLVG